MNAPLHHTELASELSDASLSDARGRDQPLRGDSRSRPTLRILGIRGIPARHGGFETFAEQLALHLVDRGWNVIVYCQEADVPGLQEDEWQGIRRILVPAPDTPVGSMIFDWRSIRHAARYRDVCMTLGYNTAIFTWRLRTAGVRNVINMDGIEWARGKWGLLSRAWFYLNDRAGCWLADRLVADHPEILELLASRGVRSRVEMITYGAREIVDADPTPLAAYGLAANRFFVVIARPEPENSILEIVEAHRRSGVDHPLVLLGKYIDGNRYHRDVKALAGPNVIFPGAIYERRTIAALRAHATAYLHGHQVGGTNPSLVEALGAGSAVIAHDNRFNRWVGGPGALYFGSPEEGAQRMRQVATDEALRGRMCAASRARWREQFTLDLVHDRYEKLLLEYVDTR